jgi:hypothetical protein
MAESNNKKTTAAFRNHVAFEAERNCKVIPAGSMKTAQPELDIPSVAPSRGVFFYNPHFIV